LTETYQPLVCFVADIVCKWRFRSSCASDDFAADIVCKCKCKWRAHCLARRAIYCRRNQLVPSRRQQDIGGTGWCTAWQPTLKSGPTPHLGDPVAHKYQPAWSITPWSSPKPPQKGQPRAALATICGRVGRSCDCQPGRMAQCTLVKCDGTNILP
jgi:hypothetical protein